MKKIKKYIYWCLNFYGKIDIYLKIFKINNEEKKCDSLYFVMMT